MGIPQIDHSIRCAGNVDVGAAAWSAVGRIKALVILPYFINESGQISGYRIACGALPGIATGRGEAGISTVGATGHAGTYPGRIGLTGIEIDRIKRRRQNTPIQFIWKVIRIIQGAAGDQHGTAAAGCVEVIAGIKDVIIFVLGISNCGGPRP